MKAQLKARSEVQTATAPPINEADTRKITVLADKNPHASSSRSKPA
jgi:hypothetical protein